MSTIVEQNQLAFNVDAMKNEITKLNNQGGTSVIDSKTSQSHPLHLFDASRMCKLYESCSLKFKEQKPEWSSTENGQKLMPPAHLTAEEKQKWLEPIVLSNKRKLYEAVRKLAQTSNEQMILLPNFDYGDILNFERFLQALKVDGVNAISKYKQFLNNKDSRKQEIDLVIIHPIYGIILFEVKDCDHLDAKRRMRTRIQLNHVANTFKTMGRLIFEAKGWSAHDAQVPITECIALPNQEQRPLTQSVADKYQNLNQSLNQSTSSSYGSQKSRFLRFVVKSDLENSDEFAKWWQTNIVEVKAQRDSELAEQNKTNKFNVNVIEWMTGLIGCIRNNSIMPIVCSEVGVSVELGPHLSENGDKRKESEQQNSEKEQTEKTEKENERQKEYESRRNMPALNINAEFFSKKHEEVRSLSKVIMLSRNTETILKTICKQILWMLLNDHQKKISVVCAEMNKPYFEEFFMRQRKIYNSCNNVRFYTDLESCTLDGQHATLKNNETWFFDSGLNKPLENVMERARELSAFWVFTTEEEKFCSQWKSDMESLKVRIVRLDETNEINNRMTSVSLFNEERFKLPLRLQCDVLVIGDIIGTTHIKNLYRFLSNKNVANLSSLYSKDSFDNTQHPRHYKNQYPQEHLAYNPTKKFKTIKFIRGGSIENIRNILKMHDSIQAPVVLMHVGDEDLLKSRSSACTIERIKELSSLVVEYCPKSFVILSTLMRRNSRTDNVTSAEVNKGIREFCRETKQSLNLYYMLNTHLEPEYHMNDTRFLNNKGLQKYIENFLWFYNFFHAHSNKQH